MTTTAVALAAAWHERDRAIVVEADPAGGCLAELGHADPGIGLASFTTEPHPAGGPTIARLLEHVQVLSTGVTVLAAPTDPTKVRSALQAPIATPRATKAPHVEGVTMIVDCGTADDSSPARPILTGADMVIVVVRADRADPTQAGNRIRAITDNSRRCAVVLIGADRKADFADRLGVPIFGTLPVRWRHARALVDADQPWPGCNTLTTAARSMAKELRTQLIRETPPLATADADTRRRLGRRWGRCFGVRRTPQTPTVYQITDPGPPTLQPHLADSDSDVRPQDLEPECGRFAALSTPSSANDMATPSARKAAAEVDARMSHLPLTIAVFGPFHVWWTNPNSSSPVADNDRVEIAAGLQPRSREVLALLAMHPRGLSRDALIDALWGESPPSRAANAIAITLSRLRSAVETATAGAVTEVLADDKLRYRLDPAVATVDYWDFAAAVRARRLAVGDAERETAYRHIVDSARSGLLCVDIATDWIAPIRETARRDTVNAYGALARAAHGEDPRTALDLLEAAIDIDPQNEQLYREALRLYAKLNEHNMIDRTLVLLQRRLAAIGAKPSTETNNLARRLGSRRT
ncbi:hypothetical protein ACFWUP_21775 [Nocardia sp. NPDC058658]|uniref:AfsR/SARP family transcriptional regulator n=1 Tax=Nocardia sp. NPDC058658 TaxID=3346580 RepID=UPI0036471989